MLRLLRKVQWKFQYPPYEGVGLREAFVGDEHTQGVLTGHGLSAVRRLCHICHRLPCCWATRGECEGGNQEEEKFCLFHCVQSYIRNSALRRRE